MKTTGQGELLFYIVGNSKRARKRFSDDVFGVAEKIRGSHSIYERILFSLLNGPVSVKKLAETEASMKSKVEEALEDLQNVKFVKKLNDEYTAALPAFNDELMRDVSFKTERVAFEMSEAVEKCMDDVILEWERRGSSLEWSSVAHLLVDAFGLDFMFLRAIKGLEKKNDVWEDRTKGQRLVPAFFLKHGKSFTNFGVNTYTKPKLLLLHGTLFERETKLTENLSDARAREVLSLLAEVKSGEQMIKGKPEIIDFLVMYNLVKEENGAYRLSIPFVHLKETQLMLPSLAELSVSAAETAFKHYDYVLQMFQGTPFASCLDGPGDYLDYIYHVLIYQTIEQLIRGRKLPAIPKPAPWNIGVFLLGGSTLKMLRTVIKMNQAVEKIIGAKTEWEAVDVPRITSMLSRITDIF